MEEDTVKFIVLAVFAVPAYRIGTRKYCNRFYLIVGKKKVDITFTSENNRSFLWLEHLIESNFSSVGIIFHTLSWGRKRRT